MRKVIDLILYSSLWVSFCAGVLVVFTYRIVGNDSGIDAYTVFVSSGTLGLYALHRIIGLQKITSFPQQGRFVRISRYRNAILACAIVGCAGALVSFFFLPSDMLPKVILPGVLSLLYALPVFRGKRLRDYDLIKIFLVASVWSWLTGVIPFTHAVTGTGYACLVFMERAAFAFAITLPFDVRDMHIDHASGVRTLAHLLGARRSLFISLVLLLVSMFTTSWLIAIGIYDQHLIAPAVLSFIFTFGLITMAHPGREDWYYSGLLDGTTCLMPLFYMTWSFLS